MSQAAALTVLCERAQQGDAQAHTALLEELYPLVRRHLFFMLRFDADLDDAVQEAMVEICRALPRMRHGDAVRAWALKVATRKARRYQYNERRHGNMEHDTAAHLAVQVSGEERADLAALLRALDKVAAKKREAFILIEMMGMSAREAALALGTFANTAASRARHAREEIKATLKVGVPQ